MWQNMANLFIFKDDIEIYGLLKSLKCETIWGNILISPGYYTLSAHVITQIVYFLRLLEKGMVSVYLDFLFLS